MYRVPTMECGDGIRRADNSAAFVGPAQVAKTAAYALQVTDTGKCFTNAGAVAEVDFTLPAPKFGLTFNFFVVANQILKVLTSNGAKINGAATSLQAAVPAPLAQQACVECPDGANWVAFLVGSWTTT